MAERRIRGVGAIVFDAAGRLLLIQRGHEPAKGQWSVPGGKVEPGETDAEAVAREVFEETGLRVRVGDRAGSLERTAGPGADWAPRVVYEIHDYDAVLVDDEDAARGKDDDAGRAEFPDSGRDQDGVAVRDDAGPGRAASDAAALRWVAPADLDSLPLTDGLIELLRSWGRLP